MTKPRIVAFLMQQDYYDPYVSLNRDSSCDGTIDPLIRLSDYEALQSERDALKAQVQTLQAHPDSWQSGYAKGRTDGTKAAMHERDELRAALDTVDGLASARAAENERLGRRVGELEEVLKAIGRHNDNPGRYNKHVDAIISEALSQQAKP